MKRYSFIAAAGLSVTLLIGCGGAPEDMEQETPAPAVEPAPQQEGSGGEVKAFYFRWQCGANTASLRDFPGGNTIAQIGYGEGIDVLGDDGGAWFYARRNATGQVGWTLKQYYCA